MKRKIFLLVALMAPVLLFTESCKKKKDEVSVVKTVPTVVVPKATKFITINVGGSFTDQGATFTNESGASSTIMADVPTGLDVNKAGLYIVKYSRATESGYNASDVRYVAVTDVSDDIDLSGDYLRAATGVIAHVTKKSRALYETDQLGGAAALPVIAYFAQLDDTTIVVPPQPTSNVGTVSASNAKVYMIPGDTTLSYKVVNPSFGTAVRTFVKQ